LILFRNHITFEVLDTPILYITFIDNYSISR